jgi:hypothetical protein
LNKHCLFYVTKTCEMYMGRRLNYWIYIVCLFYAAKYMWLLKGKNVKLLNKYYEWEPKLLNKNYQWEPKLLNKYYEWEPKLLMVRIVMINTTFNNISVIS